MGVEVNRSLCRSPEANQLILFLQNPLPRTSTWISCPALLRLVHPREPTMARLQGTRRPSRTHPRALPRFRLGRAGPPRRLRDGPDSARAEAREGVCAECELGEPRCDPRESETVKDNHRDRVVLAMEVCASLRESRLFDSYVDC